MPRCTTSHVDLALGEPEGAAGSLYVPIIFHNVSEQRCTLHGYPSVAFVAGDDGHQVGPSARPDRSDPPRTIHLAPRRRAAATLQIANAANHPPEDCRPVSVDGLRVVSPPDSTYAQDVAMPQQACSSGSVRQMSVRSVQHN